MRSLAVLCLLLLTASVCAQSPCRVNQIISHGHREVISTQKLVASSINAATIYADTHLHLVEVPVPALIFQHLPAYIAPPPEAPQQQPPTQPTPTTTDGVGTDETLAALLGAKPNPNYILDIRNKCASCHSAQNGTAKGGLTIFDADGNFNPKSKSKAITNAMLAARARAAGSEAMPPGSDTNLSKRLFEETVRFLEQ